MHLGRLFDVPIFGKKIKRIVINIEGGEQTSPSLRYYTEKKYNVRIGNYTYGVVFSADFNIGGLKVIVGNYCSFASGISFYGANHPYTHASMSPYFYNQSFGGLNVNDVKRNSLIIGNDVWIGYGVTITSGCHYIGNGAVIGAGSIVTKDVPAYTVSVGNPAKVIKSRFNSETIAYLEKSRWWEISPMDLMEFYDQIDNPLIWAKKVIKKYR